MRRIIVILLLSVFVIALSGCDKIKAELEHRHLGQQMKKESKTDASQTTPLAKKTAPTADETSSKKKQIVFRIDLPTDERIQIHLIKNPVSEAIKSEAPVPLDFDDTESKPKTNFNTNKQETNDEKHEDKSGKQGSSDEEESMGAIEMHLVQQRRKAEKQDSNDEQSRSETKTDFGIKTDREERSPATKPVFTPPIVVPEAQTTSPAESINRQEKKELSRQETTEMAPAEKAVGAALSITPPETILPASIEKTTGTQMEKKSSVTPWSIPNADYPLQYY